MDPSIVKFLEEDEDETMHSGADVDALTAALNRDIEGNKSASQPSGSDSALLSQGSNNYNSNLSVSNWHNSSQDEHSNSQFQQDMNRYQRQEPHMPTMVGNRLQNPPTQPQRVQNQQTMPPQHPPNLQRTSNQQTMLAQHPASLQRANNQQTMQTQNPNAAKSLKQVSFGQLIPVIVPQLDKDKSQQLQALYVKLRRNEVPKEGFLRLMKEIVGDQMIKMALYKLQNQARNPQASGSSQPPQSSSQLHPKGSMPHADVARQPKLDSSNEQESQMNAKLEREHSPFPPIQGLSKQQQQHFHFPQQGGFPMYGSNVNSSAATSAHMRQGPGLQGIGGAQLGTPNQSINAQRNNLNSSSGPFVKQENSSSTSIPSPMPRSITAQLNMQTHAISSVGPGNDAKTAPKKASIAPKKPLESAVSSPPQLSKKQKVSGALADQSIEQLNDVTAVSGVNLREEEEQLFSGSKEDSRVSEASQRVVKEEEERLILEKTPLQTKLAEIMLKCGVKNTSGDVERCLSLSVEERMRGLISSLIRLSKQRVDIEKSRHRTVITSDVRKQIMAINLKAREEWDKKQSEAEKLQKPNESDGSDGVDGDNEKDDGRGKSKQAPVNKEEDDKMRTNAANVAARAAVGGDDMFSKWQQMAEQARQKREGGSDVALSSQQGKEVSRRPSSSSAKASKDNQESERGALQNASAAVLGLTRKSARSQMMWQNKVARSISVKDVISVLEREPQMSKGELLYRLYEKSNPDVAE